MNSERRRHPRLPMEVEVELHVPGEPMRVTRTQDLSGSGVLLLLAKEECPAPGTQVQIRVVGSIGEGEEPPLVPARIVRHVGEGVAVEFEGI
ncbi:MAG TPA: PilZ domain-containing protein [Thioalkalivibrio sp.]|nr:PilZ domain-containing protein [Thioalkalivibrio sp.]